MLAAIDVANTGYPTVRADGGLVKNARTADATNSTHRVRPSRRYQRGA